MGSLINYAALLGGSSANAGLSSDLLTSWYAAKASTAAAAANATATTASSSATSGATSASSTTASQVVPPWDPSAVQPTPDQRLQQALSGQPMIDENAVQLSDPNASESDQKLFALYNGLAKLSAIANDAASSDTPSTMLGVLNTQFQSGLAEILTYAQSIQTNDLAVVPGQKASRITAGISVPNDYSQYTTKIISRVPTTDPMANLAGNEKFTITVTKLNGASTDVNIDLSQMGAPLTLDNLITYINTQLKDAGSVSRLSKIRLNTTNPDGTEISPPPQTWGIQIQGSSTESLTFSAPSAGPAVYIAGNSGKVGDVAAQMLKVDASGATPTLMTSARIEASSDQIPTDGTASAAPTPTSTTPTVSSDNSDSDVQATIAKLNDILSAPADSTGDPQAAPQTNAAASALDSNGNLYVVGSTEGPVNGDVMQGDKDLFLTKYDSTGQVVWQRMLGDTGTTDGLAVAVDSQGNVVVAGKTTGDLTDGTTGNGGANSFVTKYDSTGQEIFTRNVGPIADDSATAVTIGSDGSIYVGGQTKGAISSSATYGGGQDGTITKLTSAGKLVYSREFGGSGDQTVAGMATDSDGNLVVLSNDNGHAIVTKYDPTDGTSAALWSQDLGDLNGGQASAIAVDGTTIEVAGSTQSGSIGGGTIQGGYQGGSDGFVAQLASDGTVNKTTFVGTTSTDHIKSITVSNGELYIAGDTTGDLGGGSSGSVDGFAAKLNDDGSLGWVYQYSGRDGTARATSIQVDPQGSSVLDTLGLPKGTLNFDQAISITSQSTVRPGQEFYISVNGGPKRPITIGVNDTLNTLTQKINAVLLLDGTASISFMNGGSGLAIKSNGTSRIDLIAGPPGNDALKGLGLSEGTVVADAPITSSSSSQVKDNYKSIVPDDSTDTSSDKQPLYVGLGLPSDLNVSTQTGAAQVNALIQNAMSSLRSAYRTLNPDPNITALQNAAGGTAGLSSTGSGQVPQYLTDQISNYTAALQRLTAGSTTTSTLV